MVATVALESGKGPQLAIARMSARASLSFALLSFALSACTSLTEPGTGTPALQAQPEAVAAPTPAPTPPPAPSPPPQNDAQGEQIGAAHILIAYKGALRAAPTIKRTKDEAQKLAKTVLAQAKSRANFGDLAVKY